MWHPLIIRTSTIKVKKSRGKFMCALLCWLSFLSFFFHITKEDRIIKMSSKGIEKRFLLCACIHTHSSTHWDYDTMQVRVCVCDFRSYFRRCIWLSIRQEYDGRKSPLSSAFPHFFSPCLSLLFDNDRITQVI
jgi:hypothetical protein